MIQKINPIELISPQGFDRAFFRLLASPNIKTQEQAYNHLNEIYLAHFKVNRYKSYESFRISNQRRK